jgi:hypothetical protein
LAGMAALDFWAIPGIGMEQFGHNKVLPLVQIRAVSLQWPLIKALVSWFFMAELASVIFLAIRGIGV